MDVIRGEETLFSASWRACLVRGEGEGRRTDPFFFLKFFFLKKKSLFFVVVVVALSSLSSLSFKMLRRNATHFLLVLLFACGALAAWACSAAPVAAAQGEELSPRWHSVKISLLDRGGDPLLSFDKKGRKEPETCPRGVAVGADVECPPHKKETHYEKYSIREYYGGEFFKVFFERKKNEALSNDDKRSTTFFFDLLQPPLRFSKQKKRHQTGDWATIKVKSARLELAAAKGKAKKKEQTKEG